MKKSTKNVLKVSGATIAIVLVLSYWFFFASINATKSDVRIYIDNDDTADSVYTKISEAAHPAQMCGLRICGALTGYSSKVHAGSYLIDKHTHSLGLMLKLRGGRQDPIKLVIPVTHTMRHLAARLSTMLAADSATMAGAFYDKSLLDKFETDTFTVACLFIPNTYEVYWDITPENLLKRMKKEHDAFWTAEKTEKARRAGLTADEVYTLASVVEQESANEQERPMIAGMYLNRLHDGMKLQADPTVKFALQNFSLRRIMHNHLTVNSPYNTYQHTGLPAGPICIPSLNAINSVLNYSHHDYLYMCAKEDFSGTHNFAKTYAEHLQNAKKYTEALNSRGIK